MTTLTFATLTLPAASLGPENPLPVLAPPHRPSKPAGTYDPSLTEEDTRHFGYGRVGMLPHRLQDGYDRRRRPRTLRTHVAAVQPDDGGHRQHDRQMITAQQRHHRGGPAEAREPEGVGHQTHISLVPHGPDMWRTVTRMCSTGSVANGLLCELIGVFQHGGGEWMRG